MSPFTVIIGLIGLAVGSFLNVVIYRVPKMMNIALPRSYCPKCKHTIAAKYNIPLLSYLLLKGQCPYCKAKIALHYPIVELTSCILSVIIAAHYGISWMTAALLPLTWALISLVAIDLEHMILPDIITIPFLWIGLLLNSFFLFTTPQDAIIGAVAGYLSLWCVAWVFKKIRGIEGIGYGDFKLLALFGAWIGWQELPLILFGASLLGIIAGVSLIILKKHSMKKPLPFGPYIAIAGWSAILWGQNFFNWYLHFSGLR